MNIPIKLDSDKKLLLGAENRNHVLSDLSRLVDVGCKNCLIFTLKHFPGKELLNMPQAGLYDMKLLLGVENRNHVLSDLSRLVGVGCKIA